MSAALLKTTSTYPPKNNAGKYPKFHTMTKSFCTPDEVEKLMKIKFDKVPLKTAWSMWTKHPLKSRRYAADDNIRSVWSFAQISHWHQIFPHFILDWHYFLLRPLASGLLSSDRRHQLLIYCNGWKCASTQSLFWEFWFKFALHLETEILDDHQNQMSFLYIYMNDILFFWIRESF